MPIIIARIPKIEGIHQNLNSFLDEILPERMFNPAMNTNTPKIIVIAFTVISILEIIVNPNNAIAMDAKKENKFLCSALETK